MRAMRATHARYAHERTARPGVRPKNARWSPSDAIHFRQWLPSAPAPSAAFLGLLWGLYVGAGRSTPIAVDDLVPVDQVLALTSHARQYALPPRVMARICAATPAHRPKRSAGAYSRTHDAHERICASGPARVSGGDVTTSLPIGLLDGDESTLARSACPSEWSGV
jgi:hypothetical protein